MIVRACDTCKALLESDDCQFVAVRDSGSVAFKRGKAGPKSASHFCNALCAAEFFRLWLEGSLVEPDPVVEPEVMTVTLEPSRPSIVSPTREQVAEQQSILASVLGRG